MSGERVCEERAAERLLRAREGAPAEHKKKGNMKTIEYVVQDCPIMGRVVESHYVDDDECVSKRT